MRAQLFGLFVLFSIFPMRVMASTTKLATFGQLPLSFEINRGQTDSRVKFLSRGEGYNVFLTSTEAVLALRKPQKRNDRPQALQSTLGHAKTKVQPSQVAVLRMKLIGANPTPKVVGQKQLPGKSNYFIGGDAKQWHTNIAHFEKVLYKQVYAGIDLVYYGQGRQLEYDFIVAPHVDPSVIKFSISGAHSIRHNQRGALEIETSSGKVLFQSPTVYQLVNGKQKRVAGRYKLLGRTKNGAQEIGFRVSTYDRSKPLVIDPTVIYATYLGGSGEDEGTAIAVDDEGNAFVTGNTTSINFPSVAGGSQARGGSGDVFVTKINPDGTSFVYSTYFGGTGRDYARGIAVDGQGNAYLTGSTESYDDPQTTANEGFPTRNAVQSEASSFGDVHDGFVTKLNATGSILAYSTYLAGEGDDECSGIAIDQAGHAYVTGFTQGGGFPIQSPLYNGPQQGTYSYDAFITKFGASGTNLVYSTYLGGVLDDFGNAIAVDSQGQAYVTGITRSYDDPNSPGDEGFPTKNPLQSRANADVQTYFIAKINADGSALVYSSYFDSGNDIAVDTSGNAYVVGNSKISKIGSSGGAVVYSSVG